MHFAREIYYRTLYASKRKYRSFFGSLSGISAGLILCCCTVANSKQQACFSSKFFYDLNVGNDFLNIAM